MCVGAWIFVDTMIDAKSHVYSVVCECVLTIISFHVYCTSFCACTDTYRLRILLSDCVRCIAYACKSSILHKHFKLIQSFQEYFHTQILPITWILARPFLMHSKALKLVIGFSARNSTGTMDSRQYGSAIQNISAKVDNVTSRSQHHSHLRRVYLLVFQMGMYLKSIQSTFTHSIRIQNRTVICIW